MLIATSLFLSCNSKPAELPGAVELSNGIPTITLPQGSYNNTIRISDFVSDLQVVPLEMTSQSMLAGIEKVFLSEDYIYIHDMMIDQIQIFNRNGEHYGSIATKGRGPGEFNNIADFHVDLAGERLIIYDRSLYKFITYNLDGTFREEVHVDVAGGSFTVDFEGNIMLFKNNFFSRDFQGVANNISVIDSNFEIVNGFYPLNPLLINWSHGSWDHFHKDYQSKRILFNSYFDFNVYSVDKNSFEVAYKIDAGSNAMDFEELFFDTPTPNVVNERLRNSNSIRGPEAFYESDEYIHFHYWDTEVRNVIIDKRLNKIALFSGFENDLADHVIYRRIFGLEGDQILLVGPSLSDSDLKSKYGECCIYGKRTLSESTEIGNPVLFIGKLNPVENVFN